MYKIRYYYSSLSKQVFIIFVTLNILLRFAVFFAGGFYKDAYVIPSVALYFLALALCAFFFTAWKYFYFEFDEASIVSHNMLTKKETELELSSVERALFSKSGISLFCEGEEAPQFNIPLRRFGVISPVGVENFMNLMKNNAVTVEQQYDTLPGCGPSSKWVGRIYILLTIPVLINTFWFGLLLLLIFTS